MNGINHSDDDEVQNSFKISVSLAPTTTSVPNTTNMSKDSSKKSKNYKNSSKQIFYQHVTTATQAAQILFAFLIIYLCFSDEFVFFTWHPALLSIGWMFLMTEAILLLSKDNIFTGALPKSIKLHLHWIFLVAASVLFILPGFLIVYLNKDYLNKTHFKSWHGLFGLIGVICIIPACLNGASTFFQVNLRNYISPKLNKFVHIASGILTLIFGGLCLILSVYTKWFERHTNGNYLIFIVSLALVVTAVLGTLVRPVTVVLRAAVRMFPDKN